MPLPSFIRPTVSPQTIDKVGRLFNGGPADVLNELLQNARRAGATRIDIEILDLAGHPTLIVRDDGRGIASPATLLTLGASQWSDTTSAAEDPAGMGVFSMAGMRVEYRTREADEPSGWRVVIEPDAWSGHRDLAVEPFDIAGGTEVLIDIPAGWDPHLERVIDRVARHYPLPVHFRGGECVRRDWLEGALHIEAWNGSRIGIFHEPSRYAGEPTLNFHGVTVPLVLPSVSEVDRGCSWNARVDIGDTPALQLVLPARKEVVQTPFIAELRSACEAAIFRAIAKGGTHRLAHKHFVRAAEHGVALGEADPMLYRWVAPVAHNDRERGEAVRRPMIRMGDFTPPLAQTAARAISLGGAPDLTLVDEEAGFEGYAWYDALDRVTDLRLLITHDGSERIVTDEEEASDIASGRVDRLSVELEITGPDGARRILTFPTDVALVGIDEYASDADAVALLVAPDPGIEVPSLVAMLADAAFRPSDDRDCDSYETQRDHFDRDAFQLARTHLIGADAGIIGRAVDRVQDHIRWLVPEGRTLLIAAARDETMVVFQNRAPAFADEDDFTRTVLKHSLAGLHDPAVAGTALGEVRAACQERALDLMARAAASRALEGEGGES